MVQRLSAFTHREGTKKRTSQGTRKGVKKASMNKSKHSGQVKPENKCNRFSMRINNNNKNSKDYGQVQLEGKCDIFSVRNNQQKQRFRPSPAGGQM